MAINLASRLSAITTDANGITHLVWAEGTNLWHAVYNDNSQIWEDAQPIAYVGFEPVTSLNLVASPNLINQSGSTNSATLPGLAVVWQQGKDNNSDFYYTAAQYNPNNQLQWLPSPVLLTSDQVGDLEPRAIASNGTVFVVGQKVNVENAANQSIQEDTDLYYQSFTVSSDQFPTLPTPTSNAAYSPPIIQNGVIQGNFAPAPTPAPNASYNPLTAGESLSIATTASSSPAFQGWGQNWNFSQAWSSNNLYNWGILDGIPLPGVKDLLNPFFSKIKIEGILQGSSGFSPGGLTLEAFGQAITREKKIANLFKISGGLGTTYNFSNQSPNYPLNTETTLLQLTFNANVPFLTYGDPKNKGGINFELSWIGSVGVLVQADLSPNNPATYIPPLTPGLNPDGDLESLILIPPIGSAAAIAIALGAPIAEIIGGTNDQLNLNSFQIGFPLSAGVQAQLNLTSLFQLTGDGEISVLVAFGDPAASFTLGFPISLTAKLLGFINIGLGINPSWTWETNPYGSSASTATANSFALASSSSGGDDTTTPTASVQGSLLTLDFSNLGTTLNTNSVPSGSEFTVTYTDGSGETKTIPVFNVIVQQNAVILQLNNAIPYTTLNDQSLANAVQISYKPGSNPLEDSQGNDIGSFSDLSVANNTSQNITYTYTPVGGNSQNYNNTVNQIVVNFNTPLNTEIIPAVSNFTVTANGQNIAVNSVLAVTNQGVILGVASNPGSDYTVTYTPNTSTSSPPTNLQTANNSEIQQFSISSTSSATTSGLVNSTSASSSSTNQVIANLENDFAQDSPPTLALTSKGDVLLAWSSDSPLLLPLSVIANTTTNSSGASSTSVYLTFGQDLANSQSAGTFPSADQFIVTANGTVQTLSTQNPPNVSGNTVTLTLEQAIATTDTVTVSYTPTNSYGTDSNNLNFTDPTNTTFWISPFDNLAALVEDSPTVAPAPLVVESNDNNYNGYGSANILVIPFDQTLLIPDQGEISADAFTVVVNGQLVTVEQADVNATSVILSLETSAQGSTFYIPQGNLVSVSYDAAIGGLTGSNNQLVNDFSTSAILTTPPNPSTVIKTAFSPFGNAGISAISTIPGTSGMNFDPVAFLYEGSNFLVWVNADTSDIPNLLVPGQIYTDNQAQLINNSLQATDIYYSVLGLGTDNQWSVAAPLAGQQAGTDGQVTLGVGPNGDLMAAWLNTQTDSNGETTTTIYYSLWQPNSNGSSPWSTPVSILSEITPDPFTGLTIASLNGNPAIFWTETQPISYSELVLESDPVVYLRLSNLSGTTAQNEGLFGGAANGVYSGNYTLNQTGALQNPNATDLANLGDPNRAVLFSGGQVSVDNLPVVGQNFSVEFWFKVPNLPSEALDLVSFGGLFTVALNSAAVTVSLANSQGSSVTGSTSIEKDQWYYVVATYNVPYQSPTGTLNLYIDGALAGSLDQVTFANAPTTGSLILAGGSGDVYLDEVALYSTALTYDPNSPANVDPTAVNALQILELFGAGNQIGDRYAAQYVDPIPPGPQTYHSVWNGSAWQSPNKINPTPILTPTALSDANPLVWDIVANTAANANGNINPNGVTDIYLPLTLPNQQAQTLTSVVVTANLNTNGQTQTVSWAIGTGVDSSTQQLGIVQGNKLLNSLNPNGSDFSYATNGATQQFGLFVDPGNNNPKDYSNFQVVINGDSDSAINLKVGTTDPTNGAGTQVLGIATVTETEDSSLTLIDSGFIIPTDNTAIGAVLASAFNSSGDLVYVAVGNRGYTNSSGVVLQQGTVQILFAGGAVLGDNEASPLTITDLSGNPNGILITGITDGGSANNSVPMSLATGDVNGDGIPDLVIGDGNANGGNGAIYVVYGSYLNANPGTTIDVGNLTTTPSSMGFVVNGLDAGGLAGFAVVVGNFDGDNYADIVFGAPLANDGTGSVYVVYGSNSSNSPQPSQPILVYSGQTEDGSESVGYALGVSHYTAGGPTTFTGSSTTDDLIVGAPGYVASVTNQWSGQSGLPEANQGKYPSQSNVSAGAVYVFASSSGFASSSEPLTPTYTLTGPNTPAQDGVAADSFLGSAIASGLSMDLNGDGQQDLAVSATGVNNNTGVVYVVRGGSVPSGNSTVSEGITSVANLVINGGIAGSKTGFTISSPGDINDDGYQDFLINAPQAANAAGQSYLLFGPLNLETLATLFDLSPTANDSKTTFLLNGSEPFQATGQAAIGVGDINNDGVDDLLVTSPGAQQIYAVYGHPWLADDGSIKLADISADNGFVIDGTLYSVSNQTLSGTGSNVVMVGDINGDGFADVLAGGSPYGAVVTFGASTQDLLDAASGTDQLIISIANNGLIQQVGTAGDFNGDGLQDVGVLDQNNNFYLIFGNPSLGGQQTLVLSTGTLSLVVNFVTAGDYNGDGYDDLLLRVSNGFQLYLGNGEGTLSNPISFNANGNNIFNSIGDVNGDGFSDIGGGAPNSNQVSPVSPVANGQASVYFGNTTSTSVGNLVNPPSAPLTADLTTDPWGFYTSESSSSNVNNSLSGQLINNPPALAVYNGYLYMAYSATLENDESFLGGSLVVQRTADGYNWEGLTNFSDFSTSAQFSLVVFNDTLYLASVASDGSTSDNSIIVTPATLDSSSDLGLTFDTSNSVNTNQTTIADFPPTLAVYNGELYTFFVADNDDRTILYVTSTDGTTWSDNKSVTNSAGDAQASGGNLGVVADGDNLLVGFIGNGNTDLNVATLSDGNWSSSIIAGQSSDAGPSLVLVGDTLYLFFVSANSDRDILYLASTDGGTTWSSDTEVPGQTTSQGPIAVYFQESIFLSFASSTGSQGNYEINFSVSNAIYEPNLTQQFGSQLKPIGDFNGDGIADFAVLAPGFFSNLGSWNNNLLENNQGAILIYYGSTSGFNGSSNPDVVVATPAPNTSTNVANNQAYLLSQFAPAGDVNGDGYDDLIVASPNTALDSNNTTDGVAFVVFGGGNSLWGNQYGATNPFNLGFVTSNINQLTLNFAQELDTDSVPDGSAFTVNSGLTQVAVDSVTFLTSKSVLLNLNADVNLSGFVSVTYTPPSSGGLEYATSGNPVPVPNFTASNDPSINTSSAVTLSYDSSQVGQTQYGFQITGLPGSQSGISLAGGGDVNGDGFSDFIIGAPSNDDNLTYVLFGSDFNNTVNQTGTIGDDVMVGTPTGESFVAGQGDDQIYTNGGLDVVYAGPGDDYVAVSDIYFQRLDGGSGTDTLALAGYNGQDWDLTTLSPGLRLRNFEIVLTEGYGANKLTLNALTVMALSPTNTLTLYLDSTDSLILSGDFGTDPETVYQNNQNFLKYTSSTSAATVLLNQTSSTFAANSVSFGATPTNVPASILPSGSSSIATATVMSASGNSSANIGASTVNGTPSNNTSNFTTVNNPSAPTQISVSSPTVSELSGKAEFTINRTVNLDKYVWVSYLTQDGSGKAGDRYLPVAGRLLFNPGEVSKTVTVPIPNNGRFVGDRQFGLLVSLEAEGLDGAMEKPELFLVGDANGEQIRRWNYQNEMVNSGLMGGVVSFATTTDNGQSAINLGVDGLGEFNDFFSYNPTIGRYESLMFDGTTGAKFTYLENQANANGVNLQLKDGDRGDADSSSNGLVATNSYLGRSIPGLIVENNQVFWAPTIADGEIQIRLIDSPYQNYELGWIALDSPDGTIDGLQPNDPDYEAAALARKQVLFSDQDSASALALTRHLAQQSFTNIDDLVPTESQFFGNFSSSDLPANTYYMLYSQADNITTFSIDVAPTVETDSRGYHQLNFAGITTEIFSNTLVVSGITDRPVLTDVSISRAGAYENLIVLYKVDSLTGGIDVDGDRQIDLNPGDVGYVRQALTRAKDPSMGASLMAPGEFFSTKQEVVNLWGNTMYGLAIIPNASIDDVLAQNPDNDPSLGPVALFSFGAANPGGISQMSRLGSNLFGFEDIVGGGDADYNDVILQFDYQL
ncbi:SwmB domain-containing protein [Synechocystis sp. CACIAM 05]|uniref:SwmB domain-containing protein n=1 Tax=Synechocystis sp. CACIAM 05 TaxID=1933929 RepID=UPI00138E6759|nr:SwmB domain-containing protein [Synechocystis sp. CACIAM 05]QHV01360.1 hypothetical protein BWK47_15295 [Synechocystis sp. CACIAM 05]